MVRENGAGPNFVTNGTTHATNGSSASGWLCQGTHWSSFVQSGQLHLICDGHGDQKANRAEIDITSISDNDQITINYAGDWIDNKLADRVAELVAAGAALNLAGWSWMRRIIGGVLA